MTGTIVAIADIDVGVRVRGEMDDVGALADSIAAVGLLHPVVITGDWKLVAGDRRLAAVRKLGWTEVPVTIVDLTSAIDALRAEVDENECRKALTPYEAERVRDRRAQVLAEDAKRRQGSRTDLRPSPKLGGSDTARKASETAKVAAIGTGYSGSTLDKVRSIVDVAEKGVIRLAGRSLPAPEPVRQAAREALAAVQQPDARVDREHRKVAEAIAEHMQPDHRELLARQVKSWRDALLGAKAFREFDMTILPGVFTDQDWDLAAPVVDEIDAQVERFREIRPSKLRIVTGEPA